MSDYPDFSPNNYQIISELGRNNVGGRVTYLAQQTTTKQQVVIKQFQFAVRGATWAEYDAYSQEIEMLRHLNHPGIPKYLDSFQTESGFCMVQEYINAQSLAVSRSWSPQEVKKVAVAILEILIYLQSFNPSVIHRDLKPENILADKNLNIYLVDFGFARLGGGEIAASSVVKGTMGFMPPEQLFNRQLTTASDLYGLGATLICLLTGTPSGSLGNLIDENYQIKFQHLVPPLKRGLISWLEKISQPNPKHRYANAASALAVLKSLDVDRLPKVRVSKSKLEFIAEEFCEKVTETITINNPIPETMLIGRWEVAPHESDPPHTPYDHGWIEFNSYQFEGNEIECKITVDTSKLLAGESYQRELLLHGNSEGESLVIPVEVKTAMLEKPNFSAIFVFFLLFALGFSWMPLEAFLESAGWRGVEIFTLMLFSLILPISVRILNANAEEKKVNAFFTVGLSLLLLMLAMLKFNGDWHHNNLVWQLVYYMNCFCCTLISDSSATRAIRYQGKNINLLAWWVWLIILYITNTFRNFHFFWGVVMSAIISVALQFLVRYQNKFVLTRKATKNILAFCGFSISLFIAYFLTEKLFFNLYLVANNSNWNFAVKVLITLELVVIVFAPVLFYSLPLAKAIVKRLRAIARYNREKANLIKP